MTIDPETFRVAKGRGARWYQDALPPCPIVPDADPAKPYEAPSWTTIAGAWPKFLAPWAAETVAREAVTTDTWRTLQPEAAVAVLKGAPDRTRDRAAQRGTVIHRLLEQIAAGQEPMVELIPDAEPFLPAMRAFVTECRPRWILSEAVGFNRTVGYGGTTDADLFLDALPGLGVRRSDFKTRKDLRAFPENGVQVSAYAGFEYVIVPGPDGQPVRRAASSIDGGLVVVISPDGYALFPVDVGEAAQEGVRRLREFWAFFKAAHTLIGSAIARPVEVAAISDREWLRGRIAAVVAQGTGSASFLAACWPPGVPTFKASADHTPDQLALIEATLDLVEKECEVPFGPPRPGTEKAPTILPPLELDTPAAPTPLPASENACQAMIARLKALPSDLLAVVEAEASKHQVPNLRSGRVTVDEMAALDQITTTIEAEAVLRYHETVDALGEYASDNDLAPVICALACHGLDKAVLTEAEIARVRAIVAALDVLVLRVEYVADTPTLVPAPSAEAELITAHGSKSALLAAARVICEGLGMNVPRSAAAACADPLLAALLHEARLVSVEQTSAA